MVKLIPMQEADFDSYVEHSIRDYAEEHVKNGSWPPDQALEFSRREFERLLPDGLKSKNQFVFTITEEAEKLKLGMLWVEVKLDASHRQAFVYDFIVEEQYRGRGYGKQALAALDLTLREMQVESVGLHVFGHNTTAFELYKKMGYEITDYSMRKTYR